MYSEKILGMAVISALPNYFRTSWGACWDYISHPIVFEWDHLPSSPRLLVIRSALSHRWLRAFAGQYVSETFQSLL